MEKFTIIITELDHNHIKQRKVALETNSKNNHTQSINKYLKNNNYQSSSLCATCCKGPLDCKKVSDISKRMIYQYPFILEGYQVQDEFLENENTRYKDSDLISCEYEKTSRKNKFKIERLVVTKCKNYKWGR